MATTPATPALPLHGGPTMGEAATDRTQRVYAKLAGFLFLFNYVAVIFGQMVPSAIRGSGDFAETARNILASEHVYRAALTSMAVGWISVVILALALFVVLEPVNRRLAQLALFMRVGESFVGVVTVVLSIATMHLRLSAARPTSPFQDSQLEALVAALARAQGGGFQIAMTFLSVGSTLFFYLFYRSRYIPRSLAGFGMFASVVMLIASMAALTFPVYAAPLQYGWAPIFIAEVTTAFWLVIRGIRS